MYIPRNIEQNLKSALKQFPVCLITGPRQAGKSTLLKNVLKKYNYVSLDDPLIAQLARNDPQLFLASYSTPLIIDEIQYAPELLHYLKLRVDRNRQKYGQYVLTGSQVFSLMEGVSESLAGRIAIFHLYPLSWSEIEPSQETLTLNTHQLIRAMIRGFYPEFYANKNLESILWHSSYTSTYVERDVRNIKAISDINRFQTFINLLATRVGQLLNLSEIAKECGISQPTAKKWLSILESTYLIYLLKPFHNNPTKRHVKSPKLYFIDTGLLCYLIGMSNEEQFLKSPSRGHIFENMVIMEHLKKISAESKSSKLYFYRTSSGLEIDLLVLEGNNLKAYEIKFAQTLRREMATPLMNFLKDHPCKKAYVLSLQKESIPLTREVQAVHWTQDLR